MTALAGVQQKQSTLQNSKRISGVSDDSNCSAGYQRFITTETDQTLFTIISSQSIFQCQKVVKFCPIYTKSKSNKH